VRKIAHNIKYAFRPVPYLIIRINDVTFVALAQERAASGASFSVWNDNALIKLQKGGGDPTHYGDVKIEFYGHNAFVITSPTGLTILTDPWRNDTRPLPKLVPE
jgi:hypothetical protein